MAITRLLTAAIIAFGAIAAALSPLPALAQDQVASNDEPVEVFTATGLPIFEANCATCHSRSGRGSIGPNFVGNDELADAPHVIHQITRGGDEMPPFGSKLTHEEILAVGTYIRNSWGNGYGPLTKESVLPQ